jgi:hypothetical protein
MSLSSLSSEAAPSPQSPPAELADWLLGSTVHCIIAIAIGSIAARSLRRRSLHWSWAGLALALLVLLRSSLPGISTTLLVGALWATVVGRRRHAEDQESGADLAQLAAVRRSPADVLRDLAGRASSRLRRAAGADPWLRDGQLALGSDERGRVVSIPFGGSAGRHTLVVGATGSGKTVTQTWLAVNAIEHGSGAVLVDPKGDEDMCREARRAALDAGRPFLEWSPNGPSIYNPYARGSETEIADKVLAGERFTEPHYLRQAQRYLGHAVRALRGNGIEVSLQSIVEHLDPERLDVLARTLPESPAEATHAYLDALTGRQRSDLAGVRDRLAILAESDVGPWLDPRDSHAPQFELLEAVRARAVVYFNLQADRRPLLTQMLGAAIVQDLLTTTAALQSAPVATLVVIDEFSAVAADQVVRLFGRARSAGLSLLLGTQELSDLRPPGRERLLEQVIGNLSVLVAHRQAVPRSAELIASVAGTRGAWRVSRQSNGRTTRTRTREGILDVDSVMGLAPGWAAVIGLAEGRQACIARIFSAGGREAGRRSDAPVW